MAERRAVENHRALGRLQDLACWIIEGVPIYVTLYVFRVDHAHVYAHECLGECNGYLGEVIVARARVPRERAREIV